MRHLAEHLWMHVKGRRGFVHLTPKVEELVERSGVAEGLVLVNAMHITAGKLDLGPWERIFCGEFDGNRRKRVLVKIFGE